MIKKNRTFDIRCIVKWGGKIDTFSKKKKKKKSGGKIDKSNFLRC